MQNKQDQMDINLKLLLNTNVPQSDTNEDKARDRKRLKERLKKATLNGSKHIIQGGTSWLEYIFGITHGDRRAGKGRSRL